MTATQMQKSRISARPEQASTKVGKLLRAYLHKTSNSMCGIKGYASLIAKGESAEGSTGRWARKILAEIQQMEEI